MTRSSSVFIYAFERISSSAAAIGLTALLLVASDARADEPVGNPPSVSVAYSDVAFASSDGTAQVYRKLKTAARRVCGVTYGPQTLEERMRAEACYDTALADAVQKIDRPLLTALHAQSATQNVG